MDLLIALIPALLMITLVIITRKVLFSLGVGVFFAALIYAEWNILGAFEYIWNSFFGIITSIDWYLPILGFVVIIGGITAVISLIGGVEAFARWSTSKVKNPIAAQILTWILGLVICIDDYFNALVIGEVSKPITDRYKVSRAKLAYIIDSTSAPVVIMMPISTWGAYIIGLLGALFLDSGYTTHTGLSGFVAAIPYQFYPITAIILVYLIIRYQINFKEMKKFENAVLEGEDISRVQATKTVSQTKIEGSKATHFTLIIPIIVLILGTIIGMLISAKFDFSVIMDQGITVPLFFGGVLAYLCSLVFAFTDKKVSMKKVFSASGVGMFAMFKSAVAILVLAWMASGSIQDLQTGDLIADLIANSNLQATLIPVILFVIASLMAFATGTSWGSFGILLPIAIPIAMTADPTLMPIVIAAVLGGAVFGDHASPVSDTTVLSATGAQSTLHGHFISQLPYALLSAVFAAIAYLVYGLVHSLLVSYLVLALMIFLFVYFRKYIFKNQ